MLELHPELVKQFWVPLRIKALDLVMDAHVQLHHAAQFIAMVGLSYIKPEEDDSHTSMVWLPYVKALAGKTLPFGHYTRVGLNFTNFSLTILEGNRKIISQYPLDGKTKAEAMIWLMNELIKLGADATLFTSKLPFTIPFHPIAEEKPFQHPEDEILKELSNYYENAYYLLKQLKSLFQDITQVRCWPHHFDIATRIVLDRDEKKNIKNTIGIGFSPADEYCGEPYYYINMWPSIQLKNNQLSEIKSVGKWNNRDWTGIILPVSDIFAEEKGISQSMLVKDFLENGFFSVLRLIWNKAYSH